MASTTPPTLHLYDHPLSSYAQKIRIALREKSLSFTTEIPSSIRTGQPDPAFQQANPRLEVPTLIVNNTLSILDSTIILEYIEDAWPSPPLRPADAAARAQARMIEEICDTQYEAVNWGWGEILWFGRAEGELAEKLKAKVVEHTAAIQGWLMERLGSNEYFSGAEFGWGDVCAAAVVNRSRYYGFGPGSGTPLTKWLERISQRESVKATFEEFEAGAEKMSGFGEAFRSGERKREYRDHRLEWMVKSGGVEIVLEGLRKGNVRFSWP